MYFVTKNEYECSGCTACMNICAHGAIEMKENGEGVGFPVRNNDKCIDCGLCEKVCPFEHPVYKNKAPEVFAAYDRKERGSSASGGLFYTIASYVIGHGGVVFGSVYGENLKVKHVSARTLQEVQAMRGSKYVQSDLGTVFKEIKDELKKGKLVYFTGIGCQVAGLYAFLRKDYENLITSDIVCHGVPSQKMFNIHLKYLGEKYGSKVSAYSFRELNYWLTREKAVLDNGKTKYEYDGNKSPYLYAFGLGYIDRYSCFNCKFAKVPRQGDISLADFWGVGETAPQMDTSKGVSLVLVNNEKGKKLWSEIEQQLVFKKSTLQAAAKHNPNVVGPTKEPEFRKEFFKVLKKDGYAKMAGTCLACPDNMRNKSIEKIMMLRHMHIYQPYAKLKHLAKTILVALKIK